MGFDTDVLIVGAGPTGLALAATLAKHGVEPMLIDRAPEGANTSRAAVVHARTLEVLESLDCVPRLIERGLVLSRFSIRDRDRVLIGIDFSRLPTRYPHVLMIPQYETERVLMQRLEELGGRCIRPSTVTDLIQDPAGVTVVIENGKAIRARYVVGADGMHSVVRDKAGIGFSGGSYSECFMLADVRFDSGMLNDQVSLYFSPAGMLVVAPLPGGLHRVVVADDEAPDSPNISCVQRLVDERGPERTKAKVQELLWGSRFHIHHRVADDYRAGRILLAGDAAHVHSPAGGQGMNTGIQDGVALAHALAGTLANGDEAGLNAYSQARRPIARQVVQLADRLTRLATVPRRLRPIRNAVLGTLGHIPGFRRRLAWKLSGLAYR